jgi:hypothetical protein
MTTHQALAIACWFGVPYTTVLQMPLTYAARLYESVPVDHRPTGREANLFTLNGQPVTFDELSDRLDAKLGPWVQS